MVGKARSFRSTQSAPDRLRRQPANPIRDRGASRNQSPNVRVQSLPLSRHELKAWQIRGRPCTKADHLGVNIQSARTPIGVDSCLGKRGKSRPIFQQPVRVRMLKSEFNARFSLVQRSDPSSCGQAPYQGYLTGPLYFGSYLASRCSPHGLSPGIDWK